MMFSGCLMTQTFSLPSFQLDLSPWNTMEHNRSHGPQWNAMKHNGQGWPKCWAEVHGDPWATDWKSCERSDAECDYILKVVWTCPYSGHLPHPDNRTQWIAITLSYWNGKQWHTMTCVGRCKVPGPGCKLSLGQIKVWEGYSWAVLQFINFEHKLIHLVVNLYTLTAAQFINLYTEP
jgi:hypothetical protein